MSVGIGNETIKVTMGGGTEVISKGEKGNSEGKGIFVARK